MGQTLSEPVTEKETSQCENELLRVGASCMQGWRINMEDAHTLKLSINNDKNSAFFAVFDGHGGPRVAKYAGTHLHDLILNNPSYIQGDVAEAIRQGYLALDSDMLEDEDMRDDQAGTTATCVVLKDGKIYCGNAGDSRAIASVNGKVQELSFDHKPNNAKETQRIKDAGGWVAFNRVNGSLALSRALGDFVYKQNEEKKPEDQIVTAYPDVEVAELTDDHEFIVLACDGIWDVMSNEKVVEFVREKIAQNILPEKICEDLMNTCIAPYCPMGGLGCDNMTVIIICILNGEPYQKLVEKCKSSLAQSNESVNNLKSCENLSDEMRISYEKDNCLSVSN